MRPRIELTIRKPVFQKTADKHTIQRRTLQESMGFDLHLAALGTSLRNKKKIDAKQAYEQFSQKCLSYLKKKQEYGVKSINPKQQPALHIYDRRDTLCKSERSRYGERERHKGRGNNESKSYKTLFTYEQKIQLYKLIRSAEFESKEAPQSKWKTARKASCSVRPYTSKLSRPGTSEQACLKVNTIVCSSVLSKRAAFLQGRDLFTPRPVSSSNAMQVKIVRPSANRFMALGSSQDYAGQYMKRLKALLDFLFKVNFSNGLYINLRLMQNAEKYKVCVGRGNNGQLVRRLLRRRHWLQISDQDLPDAHFYWTQNSIQSHFIRQSDSSLVVESPLQINSSYQRIEQNEADLKIFTKQEACSVQAYILKDGYAMPFRRSYQPTPLLITNHLPNNYVIGAKKHLFRSLLRYYTAQGKDPFLSIPRTYHIKSADDQEFRQFVSEHGNNEERVWIVKPGQQSNRGRGITVERTSGVLKRMRQRKTHEDGQNLTYIVQSYISKPMLYHGRKFDLRHYMLVCAVRGRIKGYWYKQGYVRTCSQTYDLDDLSNPFVHLTNDAVQCHSDSYGAYEPANKLSYSQLQRYIDSSYTRGISVQKNILPRMRSLAIDLLTANALSLDPKGKENNFQVFGLDYMVDKQFNPWLIQVNANPCLQVNCAVLKKVIPAMLQNSFRLGLDPLLPPRSHFPASHRYCLSDHYLSNLKYELIFDSAKASGLLPFQHIDKLDPKDIQVFPNDGDQADSEDL